MSTTDADYRLVTTGTTGLDEVLMGGLPGAAVHLVQGEPGTGKTTIGLQFLLDGLSKGEQGLFATVSQSRADLLRIAASHDMDISGIEIHEISPVDLAAHRASEQSILHTSELELDELLQSLHARIRENNFQRFVFDSLVELRLLTSEPNLYRREILGLKAALTQRDVTALLIDYRGHSLEDRQLEGLVHGVISLHRRNPDVGVTHRRLEVEKMRGHPYVEGYHDFRITTGGLTVYPRVVPASVPERAPGEILSSGLASLDDLLGGGLDFGTTAMLVGQSGTGKSTLATLYVREAAKQGVPAAMFLFEERPEVLRTRSRDLGIGVTAIEDKELLRIRHVDAAESSPGELSQRIIREVEDHGVRVVVLDSLSGLMASMPERRELLPQLHMLLDYLGRRNVLTILTLAQHGLIGETPTVDIDFSYLTDSIILLRQYAAESRIRRSIAVVKKRHSFHRTDVRELEIDQRGIVIRDLSAAPGSPDLGSG